MVLEVRNVSILFHTDTYKKMRSEKKLELKLKHRESEHRFMAVDHVSFSLDEGETLGIIGKNGAGKSTILKAIAGTIAPTSGRIIRRRQVSALLELGTGFDMDLSVKENIYLRAALLGFSKEYLEGRYPDILAFAELEAFENRPFRALSSGMRARLGFSIVSLMRPEILILDEVFSVGDGAFRKKSHDLMTGLIKGGCSTLMVSHSIGQIRELCNRVIWIEHGRIVMEGKTDEVCDAYEKFLKTGKIISA